MGHVKGYNKDGWAKIKLHHLSEPRKDNILLDQTDTEMSELLIRLIVQDKEQQDQIKAMNLMLKEVRSRY